MGGVDDLFDLFENPLCTQTCTNTSPGRSSEGKAKTSENSCGSHNRLHHFSSSCHFNTTPWATIVPSDKPSENNNVMYGSEISKSKDVKRELDLESSGISLLVDEVLEPAASSSESQSTGIFSSPFAIADSSCATGWAQDVSSRDQQLTRQLNPINTVYSYNSIASHSSSHLNSVVRQSSQWRLNHTSTPTTASVDKDPNSGSYSSSQDSTQWLDGFSIPYLLNSKEQLLSHDFLQPTISSLSSDGGHYQCSSSSSSSSSRIPENPDSTVQRFVSEPVDTPGDHFLNGMCDIAKILDGYQVPCPEKFDSSGVSGSQYPSEVIEGPTTLVDGDIAMEHSPNVTRNMAENSISPLLSPDPEENPRMTNTRNDGSHENHLNETILAADPLISTSLHDVLAAELYPGGKTPSISPVGMDFGGENVLEILPMTQERNDVLTPEEEASYCTRLDENKTDGTITNSLVKGLVYKLEDAVEVIDSISSSIPEQPANEGVNGFDEEVRLPSQNVSSNHRPEDEGINCYNERGINVSGGLGSGHSPVEGVDDSSQLDETVEENCGEIQIMDQLARSKDRQLLHSERYGSHEEENQLDSDRREKNVPILDSLEETSNFLVAPLLKLPPSTIAIDVEDQSCSGNEGEEKNFELGVPRHVEIGVDDNNIQTTLKTNRKDSQSISPSYHNSAVLCPRLQVSEDTMFDTVDTSITIGHNEVELREDGPHISEIHSFQQPPKSSIRSETSPAPSCIGSAANESHGCDGVLTSSEQLGSEDRGSTNGPSVTFPTMNEIPASRMSAISSALIHEEEISSSRLLSSSGRQSASYVEFLQLLKCSDCSNVVDSMKRFVSKMWELAGYKLPSRADGSGNFSFASQIESKASSITRENAAHHLHTFIEKTADKLSETPPFSVEHLQESRSSLLASIVTQKPPEWRNVTTHGGPSANEGSVDLHQATTNLSVNLCECLERFLASKLFPVLLGFMAKEVKEDVDLQEKLEWMVRWISPLHLDVDERLDILLASKHWHPQYVMGSEVSSVEKVFPSSVSSSPGACVSEDLPSPYLLAENSSGTSTVSTATPVPTSSSCSGRKTWIELIRDQLEGLSIAKSPRAKLTLVLNLCRIASELAAALYKKQSNGVLDEQQIATTGASVIVAADDLLPVLIWLLIRSKPRNLLSSLEFISVFRLPSLLMSEDLYFFTMVASAVEFLKRLTVFSDLKIHADETRQFIITTCPPKFISEWVGDIAVTKATKATPLSKRTTRVERQNLSSVFSTLSDGDLPMSSEISAQFFTINVYSRFLFLLRDPECSDIVAHLRRFIDTVFQAAEQNSGKINLVIRPDRVHSVISITIRKLERKKHIFNWRSLVNQAPVGIAFESHEQLSFSNSDYQHRDSEESQTKESPKGLRFPTRRLLKSILAPFSQSPTLSSEYHCSSKVVLSPSAGNRSNVSDSTSSEIDRNRFSVSHHPPLKDEPPNSALYVSMQRLKSVIIRCLEKKIQIDQTSPSGIKARRATEFARKRLEKLDALMSPLEKLRCIVTLCHIAGGLADEDETSFSIIKNDKSTINAKRVVMLAEVALLLLKAHPLHLEANLEYIANYRHPILLGSEAQTYLFVVKIAAAAIESVAIQLTLPDEITTIDELKQKLKDAIINQIPAVPTRIVPNRFEHEI